MEDQLMGTVCNLEDDLIHPDAWRDLHNDMPKECRDVVDYHSGDVIGIGRNDEYGWFIMGSGQGPALLWSEYKPRTGENEMSFISDETLAKISKYKPRMEAQEIKGNMYDKLRKLIAGWGRQALEYKELGKSWTDPEDAYWRGYAYGKESAFKNCALNLRMAVKDKDGKEGQ